MKLEPKQIQQEVSEGLAWPVYWIYGPETFRVREVCKLLRGFVVGDRSLAEETLEGAQTSASEVLSSAAMVPFDGGTRVVWVRDAHLMKDMEGLQSLFGPRGPLPSLGSVCILIAKDLDARKKLSKALLDKAAVVACDSIPEDQRGAWVRHFAQQRGIQGAALPVELLVRYEPWSLDWLAGELDKFQISEQAEPGSGVEVLLGGTGASSVGSDFFIEAFLEHRSLRSALQSVELLAQQPEQALPLLGLLSWNVRMMGLLSARSRSVRLPPILETRLRRAVGRWSAQEIQELQSRLSELDFSLKQTPQEPLALWGVLVQQFCQ